MRNGCNLVGLPTLALANTEGLERNGTDWVRACWFSTPSTGYQHLPGPTRTYREALLAASETSVLVRIGPPNGAGLGLPFPRPEVNQASRRPKLWKHWRIGASHQAVSSLSQPSRRKYARLIAMRCGGWPILVPGWGVFEGLTR